jgi:shikimate kinase
VTSPLLVLVGPPASGKTTIGTAVAQAVGVAFRDTDRDVELETGTTVAEVFIDAGEPRFRELEERAVARALAEHDGVVALGGGAVTSAASRALLVDYGSRGGVVVWLDVDLQSAAKRVGLSRDRPLLSVNPRAMLRTMLEARGPLYAEVATHTVGTSAREPADVVAEVVGVLRGTAPGR